MQKILKQNVIVSKSINNVKKLNIQM